MNALLSGEYFTMKYPSIWSLCHRKFCAFKKIEMSSFSTATKNEKKKNHNKSLNRYWCEWFEAVWNETIRKYYIHIHSHTRIESFKSKMYTFEVWAHEKGVSASEKGTEWPRAKSACDVFKSEPICILYDFIQTTFCECTFGWSVHARVNVKSALGAQWTQNEQATYKFRSNCVYFSLGIWVCQTSNKRKIANYITRHDISFDIKHTNPFIVDIK